MRKSQEERALWGKEEKRQLEIECPNKEHEPSASLCDSMHHIVRVPCSFSSASEGETEGGEIRYPTVWEAHRLGGGGCTSWAALRAGWRSPSIWSNGKLGPGRRHHPEGAAEELGRLGVVRELARSGILQDTGDRSPVGLWTGLPGLQIALLHLASSGRLRHTCPFAGDCCG